MTDELIADTQRVWARRLGRDIPRDEAIEMLMNVKRIAEAFHWAAQTGGGQRHFGLQGHRLVLQGHGPEGLRLHPERRGHLAAFKYGQKTRDLAVNFFEPHIERHKSLFGKEKAVQLFR